MRCFEPLHHKRRGNHCTIWSHHTGIQHLGPVYVNGSLGGASILNGRPLTGLKHWNGTEFIQLQEKHIHSLVISANGDTIAHTEDAEVYTVRDLSQTLQSEATGGSYFPSFTNYFDKICIIATTRG
jgi:hypothetical protein